MQLQTSFYVVLAAIPLSIGTYILSRPSAEGPTPFTKFINSYSDMQQKFTDTNTLHTKAIEAAAFDKNLFYSDKGSAHVDLRFPEFVYPSNCCM
jgi:hypothetical protein